MTSPLIWMGSLGGITAAFGAIVIVGRGIFRQISATEDNTEALKNLTDKVDRLTTTVSSHETRITVLESRDPYVPPRRRP